MDRDYIVGERVGNEGIFIGEVVMRPTQSCCCIMFNVFAAPEDLRNQDNNQRLKLSHEAAANTVAQLRNWHGHDGIYAKSDEDLLNKLSDYRNHGKWIVPSYHINNTLLARAAKKGSLKQSFALQVPTDTPFYMSLSTIPSYPDTMLATSMIDGGTLGFDTQTYKLPVRPVRLKIK